MFNREKTPEAHSGKATLIAAGTELRGDIHSDHDLRIDGTVLGGVTSTARIIIGPEGRVEGDLESQQAEVTGRVKGDIRVEDLLQLRGTSIVEGNIAAARLQIEPSATFNGQCQMGAAGTVLTMKAHERKTEAAQ